MKEQTAAIVAAYVGHNTIAPDQLPTVIKTVETALSQLGQKSVQPAELIPAVPIRRSVGADQITCLECGWHGSMLKRHLATAHHTTPEDYRSRWSLPGDYPIVAKNYAARRSALAKQFGLGNLHRGRPTTS